MCSDPGTNYTLVCGEDVIGCTGSYITSNCKCNTKDYFIPAPDGRSCQPGNAIASFCNRVATPPKLNVLYIFSLGRVPAWKVSNNSLDLSQKYGPYPFKFFKGYPPQISLVPFLNTLSHVWALEVYFKGYVPEIHKEICNFLILRTVSEMRPF